MTSENTPADRATATVRGRRKRLSLAGLACTALTAVVLSAATPALAAPTASSAAVVAASKTDLPKLNEAALQAAVEGSSVSATAMLARVSRMAGQWTGTSGVARPGRTADGPRQRPTIPLSRADGGRRRGAEVTVRPPATDWRARPARRAGPAAAGGDAVRCGGLRRTG